MRNLILVCCGLTLGLGILAGCNKTAEQAAGQAVEKVAGAPDSSASAASQGGQADAAAQSGTTTAAAGGQVSMPSGWLESLPPYPDGKIIAAYSTGSAPDLAFMVKLSTPDSGEQVMAFYKDKALAAGFSQVNAVSGEEDSFARYTSKSWNFNVTCTTSKGTTEVMLALGAAGAEGGGKSAADGNDGQAGDGGESAMTGAGGQPEADLAKILMQYPQAQVDNSVDRGTQHLMTQRTADAPAAVIKFYSDYFTGKGWVLDASIDSDAGMMRSFKRGAGQLVLNTNPRDDGTFITLNYKEQ